MNNKNKEKLSKKDYKANKSFNMFLIAFQKNNKTDLKESESFRNVSLTKKNQSKEESKDKEKTKKLLKLQLMKIKIKVNLK